MKGGEGKLRSKAARVAEGKISGFFFKLLLLFLSGYDVFRLSWLRTGYSFHLTSFSLAHPALPKHTPEDTIPPTFTIKQTQKHTSCPISEGKPFKKKVPGFAIMFKK